jgi:hypothetical protein
MEAYDLKRLGTGKTGRINPRDARYSLGQNPKRAIAICGWADDLLVKLSEINKCGKSEMVMRLIERAADVSAVAVVAITLGMMAAECFDK